MLAPIILFVYNRLWHTRQTVEALQKNELATESELYVFCDGPKEGTTDEQREKVHEVQEYVQSINGFKKLHIKVQKSNRGLANSVISGVTEIIEKFGKVIVVEDDIVTHPFFLRYMNDCLDVYEDRFDIFMIGGYNYNIRVPRYYNKDVYVVHRSCSWGWATWIDRWERADWNVDDYQQMCNDRKLQDKFNRGGSDMFPMLQAQMEGKIDSWGIRWDYCMYKHNALCVHPIKSLCTNCGMDGSGVHCGTVSNNYTAPLYNSENYQINISKEVILNQTIAKEFSYFQESGGRRKPKIKNSIIETIKGAKQRLHYFLARRLKQPYIPVGAILMLHRIDNPDDDGILNNQHLKLSEQTIEKMVDYGKKQGCLFVSITELSEALRRKKTIRKWIAITLDDGYRDNFINGKQLFRKLNVPYTIYICTKMVKKEMLYWWEILEQLVLKNDEIVLNDGRTFDCSTKKAKEQAFLDIRAIFLKLPQDNLIKRLNELFENYEIDYNYGNDSLGLTWEQIKELKKDPLATIGNHTYSHCAFTGCTDDEICADIKHATDDMLANTGINMQHFAFPFGEATAVSQHDVDLIKQLGFKTSATTKDGLVCYGTDPLELPRLFVTERNWKQVIDRIVANC